VRSEYAPKLVFTELWYEFHVPKRVVVAHVAVKASDVSNELLPIVSGQALHFLKRSFFELFEIFLREISLEQAEQ